ncbi:hypothetical protein CGLO_13325 [Colletotrichum gloeosporioides Cg-14]|uniref:Uncharacterized protein n=1 Tax=Colletotrichum gloeosporioides (strain Cg-14) TaxID=1237896 RepID=T0K6C0_COLGC|nr:hypothetical protein CGLO_13325 [Colletotrichum gloeosporioides Cg-14]
MPLNNKLSGFVAI